MIASKDNCCTLYVASSDGSISCFTMDKMSGKLSLNNKLTTGAEVSFLCISPNNKFLYATLRDDKSRAEVASYSIDNDSGALKLISTAKAEGLRPVHLSLDMTGKYLFQANFKGGNFSVFPVKSDGTIQKATQTINIGDNPHMIRFKNSYVYVTHLGSDIIAQYFFDYDTGSMVPNVPNIVHTAKGAGPRHFDFHKNGKWLYVVNELGNSVTFYNISKSGTLNDAQSITTLPEGYAEQSKTADIHVHPTGKFLYASNRGHNSIAVYLINENDGRLKLLYIIKTLGDEPRTFAIDPGGNFLVVGNRMSNQIRVFRIDTISGQLHISGDPYDHPLPLCHMFV